MNYLLRIVYSAPVIVALSLAVIICLFETSTVYTHYLSASFDPRLPKDLSFMVAYSMVFMLVLPAGVAKFLFREDLRDLGLRRPVSTMKAGLLIIGSLVLMLPFIFFIAKTHQVQVAYSLKKFSFWHYLLVVMEMPPYLLAEEFFFRGFLFMPLYRKMGWHSYWITEMLFTFAHLGKPIPELIFSFPAGLVLNYIALKSKSIYPSMIVHFIVGFAVTTLTTY